MIDQASGRGMEQKERNKSARPQALGVQKPWAYRKTGIRWPRVSWRRNAFGEESRALDLSQDALRKVSPSWGFVSARGAFAASPMRIRLGLQRPDSVCSEQLGTLPPPQASMRRRGECRAVHGPVWLPCPVQRLSTLSTLSTPSTPSTPSTVRRLNKADVLGCHVSSRPETALLQASSR